MKQGILKILTFFFYFLSLSFIGFFIVTGFFCNFMYNGLGLLFVSFICVFLIFLSTYLNTRVNPNAKKPIIYIGACLCLTVYFVNIAIVLFGLRFSYVGIPNINLSSYMINNIYLHPFSSIKNYLYNRSLFPIIGNLLLLFPLGFFLPLMLKKARRKSIFIVVLLLFCFAIELLQLLTKLGSFDIDDIILNCIGGLIGYIILLQTKAYVFFDKLLLTN